MSGVRLELHQGAGGVDCITVEVVDPHEVQITLDGWDPSVFRMTAAQARALAVTLATAANLAEPRAVCTCEPTRPPGDHERVCPAFGVRS